MAERLDVVISRAVAAGLLPDGAALPGAEARPWPVVLLTALGAWLAAIPLLGVVGLLLGPLVDNPVGPYLIGALVLAGSAVVLRSASVPLFVEQLAVPGVLVGGGSLGFGLFRDLPDAAAALLLAGVSLALAFAVRQAWLRGLLGAAMAALVGLALLAPHGLFGRGAFDDAWLACHLLLVLALAAPWVQSVWRGQGALVEALSSGWWAVTLAGLAVLSGMSFLVGGALGAGVVGEVARDVASEASYPRWGHWGLQATSAVLALVGAAVAARRWPLLRQPALALVAAVLAGLAWAMPTLGGVVLGLGCMLVTQRWRLAAAAAVAFAWIVGAFYYALVWALATKALVLVAAGALTGAVAWWLRPREVNASAEAPVPFMPDRRALWVGLATVATVAVAGVAIWQKQDLIAHGQPVYVALAPVDPRSLMQGDYMRLNFRVPAEVLAQPPAATARRPRVLARRDARGVATLVGEARPGTPLAPGEFLFELTPKGGRWILVTDAWFFREGEGARWAAARYGEFRVMPDGRALLVGMADAELKPILP
ncbi:MAG: GDYXXLXY domain-containing protein [Rhizobacter sp.]|nr:GDYXXLXY domain-containing protein [Rhizobacter sp.]